MKLIIGLGNPGKNYAQNRHNTGFRCINYLSRKYEIDVKQNECHSLTGIGQIQGVDVKLVKPKTFVNNSGIAVASLMQKYIIPISDVMVIYDDLDLPLGKIRIRPRGNSGGHKGIKSIIESTGNQDFIRIRIGIGRPQGENITKLPNELIVNYVLSDFTPEEEIIINETISKVADAIECILLEGVVIAMSKFN